jgi:hypothetical protein
MRDSINKMDDLTSEYATTADEFATAEAEFKIAFAKARLTARSGGDYEGRKMTADLAEDLATVGTETEKRAYEAARAKHDATRQALMSVRSRLEALRSLMASHREAGG